MNPEPERMSIITIDLWGQHDVECGICEQWGNHRHAVGWYCGPVQQDPGEFVPGWGLDAIAGGRTVCKACHDQFYGIVEPQQPIPQPDLFDAAS